jgi:hypothetical protein
VTNGTKKPKHVKQTKKKKVYNTKLTSKLADNLSDLWQWNSRAQCTARAETSLYVLRRVFFRETKRWRQMRVTKRNEARIETSASNFIIINIDFNRKT